MKASTRYTMGAQRVERMGDELTGSAKEQKKEAKCTVGLRHHLAVQMIIKRKGL